MTALIPAWRDGALKPTEKLKVHRLGLRHPAVSVFVMEDGRTLLQRRAAGKYHTPGLWANACCTHPHWGEAPEHCARRRLGQELGLHDLDLAALPPVEYRADVGGGMIEHEVVSLFLATRPALVEPAPDAAEVMALRWITPDALRAEIAASPQTFTPWLRIYMAEHGGVIFGADAPPARADPAPGPGHSADPGDLRRPVPTAR